MSRGRGSIHQVVDIALSGDSITNDALGIGAQLRSSRSPDSEIWALDAPGGLIGAAMRVVSVTAGSKGFGPGSEHETSGSEHDTLIVHVRDPDSPIWTFLQGRPERVIIRLHGWQRSGSRPLKMAAARPGPTGRPSPSDRLAGLGECVLRADVSLFAVLATSPTLAALATAELRGTEPGPVVSVVPPFFPYDEFAIIGATRDPFTLPSDPVTARDTAGDGDKPADKPGDRRNRSLADAPRILCVGRLEPHAEIEQLLVAMHLATTGGLDPSLLIVVGRSSNPAYETALRELARDLRINVFFGGHCSQPDLLGLMRSASVLVSPGRSSGFGVRFVEAMAAGVPVIGRAEGAVVHTVGRAGILIDPSDDVEVLAQAIIGISTDKPWRAELIRAGRQRAAELAPAHSAGLLHDFLQSADALTSV